MAKTTAIETASWTNWAGNVRTTPRAVVQPESLAELRAAVMAAARRGEQVRVAGAGHSFAPLCATNGTLLDLSLLSGIEQFHPETGEATIWAGTRIADLGAPLLTHGWALANQGDIDRQAIAGAVSTGTHGTGRKHGSFSAMVRAVELMLPDGELLTLGGADPMRLRAAALNLGMLGVVTRVTLATVPAYKLREHTRGLPFDACLDGFLGEETSHRNAEFWWLPAHDVCVLKTFVETEADPFRVEAPEAPPGAIERYLKPDAVDWSWRIYPSTRSVPFVEMEYTLPLHEGPTAMREVRHLMLTRHPDCTWAVEYRTQPGETSLLSPTQGAESVTISLHQAMDLPYEPPLQQRRADLPRPRRPPPLGQAALSGCGGDHPALSRIAGVPGHPRGIGSGRGLHERLSGEAGTGGRYVFASALITASGSLSITRNSVRAALSG